jgi:hemerythrin superfamily protein
MAAHESAEQTVVYAALVAARPEAKDAAGRRLAEQTEVNELVAEMGRLEPASAGFEKRAGALALELRAHFAAEEDRLFPQLREAFTDQQLVALADEVAEAKRRATAAAG